MLQRLGIGKVIGKPQADELIKILFELIKKGKQDNCYKHIYFSYYNSLR